MTFFSTTLFAVPIGNPALSNQLTALNGVSFTQRFVQAAILIALVIGVVVFFFNLLTGGIAYISSGGDKAKTEAARGKLTNAIIGLIILFSMYGIVNLLEAFLGTDLTLLDLNSLRIR